MNDLIKFDENKPIKQSNRLIEAKYKLTKYEQRMILAICSQLDKNAENFDTVRVSVSDMAKFCNYEEKKGYTLVKNTIMRLLTRTLQIKRENGGWYATHWLQSAEYIPSESVIEYRVDDKLKPELLQLKQAYLSTPALPLMEFRSDYSIRFYLLLKKMLKIKDFEYELDFIRERFQLSNSYQQISNLKNYVIEPALAEINEKSDINVEHEYIKEGRICKKIHFIVTLKEENSTQKSIPETSANNSKQKKADLNETLEDIEQKTGQIRLIESDPAIEGIIERLAKYEISKDTTINLVDKYGIERVDDNLKYAYDNRNGKTSMSGWIISCIKHDQAAAAAEARQIADNVNSKPKQSEYNTSYNPDAMNTTERKSSSLESIGTIIGPIGSAHEPLPEDSLFKKYERRHVKRKNG